MIAFTYGRRLNKNGGKFISVRERLLRIEEKRDYRKTLKTLYEKKAKSICGERDYNFLDK
jgi:hypothetical protein